MNIHSNMEAEKLLTRIRENCDPAKLLYLMDANPTKPIVGSFDGDEFSLWVRSRNNYKPTFYGKVASSGGGSEITGNFQVRDSVRVIYGIQLTLVSLFCLIFVFVLVISFVRQGRVPTDFLPFGIVSGAFLLILLFTPKMGWEKDKDSIPFIVQFLNDCASGK